jgi:hypothetical protein
MRMQFRFGPTVRPHVARLCDLCEFANGIETGKWSHGYSRHDPANAGVYGHAREAIDCIIREVVKPASVANRAIETIEFGCTGSWLEDVEEAISEAFDEYNDAQSERFHD